jgi:hypothetical protein
VIDTGVALARRDWLTQRVREVYRVDINGNLDLVYQRDVTPNLQSEELPKDAIGHGTVMAELIGRPGLGMAPDVDLYCYRVVDPRSIDARCGCPSVRAALEHARDRQDIHVVNISLHLASDCDAQTLLALEEEYNDLLTALRDAGKVVIMAAGNLNEEYPHLNETCPPGRSRPGVTVGAATRDSGAWEREDFSLSYHSAASDSYVPDVYAPAGFVAPNGYEYPVRPWRYLPGTSDSTALTSGLAALGVQELLAQLQSQSQQFNSAHVERLCRVLTTSGTPVTDPHAPPDRPVRVINVPGFLNWLRPQ